MPEKERSQDAYHDSNEEHEDVFVPPNLAFLLVLLLVVLPKRESINVRHGATIPPLETLLKADP